MRSKSRDLKNSIVKMVNEFYDEHRRVQLSSRFDELTALKEEKLAKRRSIERFIATLSKQENLLTEFDNWLWLSTVERVTVKSDGILVSRFYYGAEIEG